MDLLRPDGRQERHVAPGVPGEEAFGWPEVDEKARRLARANGIEVAEMDGLLGLVRRGDWRGLMAALGGSPGGDDPLHG